MVVAQMKNTWFCVGVGVTNVMFNEILSANTGRPYCAPALVLIDFSWTKNHDYGRRGHCSLINSTLLMFRNVQPLDTTAITKSTYK